MQHHRARDMDLYRVRAQVKCRDRESSVDKVIREEVFSSVTSPECFAETLQSAGPARHHYCLIQAAR